jgi:hypothetical protein
VPRGLERLPGDMRVTSLQGNSDGM